MFGGPPPGYQPSETELDLKARWLPTAERISQAIEVLTNRPASVTYVYLALAQPDKEHGFWATGQVVEQVPGVFDTDSAACAAADKQLGDRPGTVAYCPTWRDGHSAVFEGFRPSEYPS